MRLPQEVMLYVLAFVFVHTGLHQGVWANTEIVNFAVLPGPDTVLPQSWAWPELSAQNTEKLIKLFPALVDTPVADVCTPITPTSVQQGGCAHETWITLNFDDDTWTPYSKFTLRVSWPASHPADFRIDIYDPTALSALVHGSNASQHGTADVHTRRNYARIRLVDTGVLPVASSLASKEMLPNSGLSLVPFIVTLEPLLFGVLPASLLPTIGFIAAVALVAAAFVVPRIHEYLAELADRIRTETAVAESRKAQ